MIIHVSLWTCFSNVSLCNQCDRVALETTLRFPFLHHFWGIAFCNLGGFGLSETSNLDWQCCYLVRAMQGRLVCCYSLPSGSAQFHHESGNVVFWPDQLCQRFLGNPGENTSSICAHLPILWNPFCLPLVLWESLSKTIQLCVSRKDLNRFWNIYCAWTLRRCKTRSVLRRVNSACRALTQGLCRGFLVTRWRCLTSCMFEAESSHITCTRSWLMLSVITWFFSHMWTSYLPSVLNKCALLSSFPNLTE